MDSNFFFFFLHNAENVWLDNALSVPNDTVLLKFVRKNGRETNLLQMSRVVRPTL